jgi:hypothetical protein
VTAPCDRFERERLADGAAGVDGAVGAVGTDGAFVEHLAGCAGCQEHQAKYRRLTEAIKEVSAAARRRPDHVARVLAGVADEVSPVTPLRRRRWRRMAIAVPVAAMAAGLALVWWLRREPVEPAPRFAMEIVEKDGAAMRGEAQLGDLLRVRARPGAAIWIYRNDRELLLVCPRDCRRDGDGMVGEVELDAVGHYQVVWLSTDRVPAPNGELERDLAAAAEAGASREMRDLEVQ